MSNEGPMNDLQPAGEPSPRPRSAALSEAAMIGTTAGLVRSYREGNREAGEELGRRMNAWCRARLHGRLPPSARARATTSDLCQDVLAYYLRIFASLDRLAPGDLRRLALWKAQRVLVDAYRRHERRRERASIEGAEGTGEDAGQPPAVEDPRPAGQSELEELEYDDMLMALVVGEFGEEGLRLLKYRCHDQLTNRETGELFGFKEDWARKRLSGITRWLASRLEGAGG